MRLASLVAAALLAGTASRAQAPDPPDVAFEVASVKLNPDETVREAIALQPDGSVRFTAFPLRTLIAMAYRAEGIQRFDQLIGGPPWVAVDRFDIAARPRAGNVNAAEASTLLLQRLRTLLRDRFRLQVHADMRPMPGFALVVARRDGTLGPALRPSTIACASADDGNPEAWCGIRAAGGVVTGHAVTAAQLAGNLAGYPVVDRFVVDQTGLPGRYDFRLEYSPAFLQSGTAASDAGPSLFTALTEQLGLALRPETMTLPVMVIDRIERPLPD